MQSQRWFTILILSFFVGGFTSCSRKGGLVLVGLNDRDEVVRSYLSAGKSEDMGEVLNTMSGDTLNMLGRYESQNAWELSRIYLGIGLTGSLGLKPVSLEAGPSIELIFDKK